MFDEKKKKAGRKGGKHPQRQEALSASGLLEGGGNLTIPDEREARPCRSRLPFRPPFLPLRLSLPWFPTTSPHPPPAACPLRSHCDGSQWHGLSRHSRAASTTAAKTPEMRERNGKETLWFSPLLGSGGKLLLPPPLLFPFVFPGGEHPVGCFDSEGRRRDLLTRGASKTTQQTAFSICRRRALQSFFPFFFFFCSGLRSPQTVKATGIYFSFIHRPHMGYFLKKLKPWLKKKKEKKYSEPIPIK